MMMGRVPEGIVYLKHAMRDARMQQVHEVEANALACLVRAHLELQAYEQAHDYLQELTQMSDASGSEQSRAVLAHVRGELLFAQGRNSEALSALQEGILAAQSTLDRGALWKLHAAMSCIVDNKAVAEVHMQIAADFIKQTAEPLQDPGLKSTFLNAPPVLAVLAAAGIKPEHV